MKMQHSKIFNPSIEIFNHQHKNSDGIKEINIKTNNNKLADAEQINEMADYTKQDKSQYIEDGRRYNKNPVPKDKTSNSIDMDACMNALDDNNKENIIIVVDDVENKHTDKVHATGYYKEIRN